MSKNLLFCWYQQIKIHCVQVFKPTFCETRIISLKLAEVLAAYFHWKQNQIDFNQERYENCWCQQTLFRNFRKNVWRSIHLPLFVDVACLYQNKWLGVQFYNPPPKKSLKNPNQKWVKCCMKATITQVLLKISLCSVHFSKRYLKKPWWTFSWKIRSKRTYLWFLWNLFIYRFFQVSFTKVYWAQGYIYMIINLHFTSRKI